MPTFDYKCKECGFTAEYCTNKSVPPSMKPPEKCPECNKGKMEKLFSATGQSVDVIGGYDYQYGKKAWKKNLSQTDQAKVLSGEIDPY